MGDNIRNAIPSAMLYKESFCHKYSLNTYKIFDIRYKTVVDKANPLPTPEPKLSSPAYTYLQWGGVLPLFKW